MLLSIAAIGIGAALGALLRWALALQFNAVLSSVPLGTLAANLVGGFLIGVAVAFFAGRPDLPPQWRLLIITGFLGGLTTFSTFSAEVVAHLTAGRMGWAAGLIALHVSGSLVMTLLGMALVNVARSAAASAA
ncbi:MAG TPA: fluoride efflux transporter CrcB [Acetobacteraceae bacterium]